jgi:cyclohexyl-isocyanide hydratase
LDPPAGRRRPLGVLCMHRRAAVRRCRSAQGTPGDDALGASFHLLRFFGAIPVNQRVVLDGAWIFAAGVTAGIDGALRLAAELRGDAVAQAIQLSIAYAPEPPFDSGTTETASPAIVEQARRSTAGMTARREETARRIAARLGISVPAVSRPQLAENEG